MHFNAVLRTFAQLYAVLRSFAQFYEVLLCRANKILFQFAQANFHDFEQHYVEIFI